MGRGGSNPLSLIKEEIMAVVLMNVQKNFIGLSTDAKPTTPAAGSRFYETDTQLFYIYDGAAWRLSYYEPINEESGTD